MFCVSHKYLPWNINPNFARTWSDTYLVGFSAFVVAWRFFTITEPRQTMGNERQRANNIKVLLRTNSSVPSSAFDECLKWQSLAPRQGYSISHSHIKRMNRQIGNTKKTKKHLITITAKSEPKIATAIALHSHRRKSLRNTANTARETLSICLPLSYATLA